MLRRLPGCLLESEANTAQEPLCAPVQRRAIGGNLNQLTMLANMGRVSAANLDGAAQELANISAVLREIQERGRWSR